ncbi:MAG: hypothetical protein PWP52_355 [Bacteroidales bacterium]|nr:hypothetical protein [Bacteroidales bacterium]
MSISGLIKVNTDDLRSNADNLISVSSEISGIINNLKNSINAIVSSSPSDYRDQLSDSAGSISSQAANNGESIQNSLQKLGSDLENWAVAFENADTPSGQSIASYFGVGGFFSNNSLLSIFSKIAGYNLIAANLVFSITGLKTKISSLIYPQSIISQNGMLSLLDSQTGDEVESDIATKISEKGLLSHSEIQSGNNTETTIETLPLAEFRLTDNCLSYVKEQRKSIGKDTPAGMCNDSRKYLYDGTRFGQNGVLTDGNGKDFQYGQEPTLGAIMVESPLNSPSSTKITHGHVSIISEVTKDFSGHVLSFRVSEDNGFKSKDFVWNSSTSRYENSAGRIYDCFVY